MGRRFIIWLLMGVSNDPTKKRTGWDFRCSDIRGLSSGRLLTISQTGWRAHDQTKRLSQTAVRQFYRADFERVAKSRGRDYCSPPGRVVKWYGPRMRGTQNQMPRCKQSKLRNRSVKARPVWKSSGLKTAVAGRPGYSRHRRQRTRLIILTILLSEQSISNGLNWNFDRYPWMFCTSLPNNILSSRPIGLRKKPSGYSPKRIPMPIEFAPKPTTTRSHLRRSSQGLINTCEEKSCGDEAH